MKKQKLEINTTDTTEIVFKKNVQFLKSISLFLFEIWKGDTERQKKNIFV